MSSLTISSDGRLLVGGMNNGMIRLWRLPDGEVLTTLIGYTDSVSCVAISSDGRMLARGSEDYTVRLWRLPEGAVLNTPEYHRGDLYHNPCLAFSANGQFLASAGSSYYEDQAAWAVGIPWRSAESVMVLCDCGDGLP